MVILTRVLQIIQVDYDHCKSNPCHNDAQCLNMADDYYCHCAENWQDKNCSTPKIKCTVPPCDSMFDSDIQTSILKFCNSNFISWLIFLFLVFSVEDNCLMVMPADLINMNSLNDTLLRVSSTYSLHSNAGGLSAAICNNHGRCTMRSDGDFKCLCDAGYTGRYCQDSESYLLFSCFAWYFDDVWGRSLLLKLNNSSYLLKFQVKNSIKVPIIRFLWVFQYFDIGTYVMKRHPLLFGEV